MISLEKSRLYHVGRNGNAFSSLAGSGPSRLRDFARKRFWQKFPLLKTPFGLPVPFDSSVFAWVMTPAEEATTLILQKGAKPSET